MSTIPTLAERDRRIESLRSAMAIAGLDALLVAGKGHWWTGRGYLRYLCDFHLWGHDGLALLARAGEPVLALTSPAIARMIAERGWITDARGDFALVPTIAAEAHVRGLARARIGVVGFDWVLPAGRFEALRRALPDAVFVPADALFDAVRAIKSPVEVEQMREVWTVLRASMAAFEAALAPGRPQREVAAAAIGAAHALGARDVLALIGEHPERMGPPTGTPLACQEVVRFHLEICGESGHWAERTTMFAFREPTDLELALTRAEVAAFDAVRGRVRDGTTLRELAAVYEAALSDQGFPPLGPSHHFDVHGQGLDAIEFPRYSSGDPAGTHPDAILRAGMVLSYHPARPVATEPIWGPDIHDDVLVRADGLERLSGDWPFDWRVLRP